jgi:amino-acid N-acetyltransferase
VPQPPRTRAAAATDIDAVRDLLAACNLPLNGVERQLGDSFVLAFDEGGRLVGMAGVERYQSDGLFRSAAVHPDWQGRGLGQALTHDRIAWARASGLRALYLLTETAAEFWPRFGFARIDRGSAPRGVAESPEWAGGCPASAVAMFLALEPDRVVE